MKVYNGNNRRLISESTPTNFEITTVRISDITASTQRFFENNFRGAILIEEFPFFHEYVDTSPDGIAYFFKVLLNAVFGDSVVRISMEKEDGEFLIKTRWRYTRDISDGDIFELEKTARLSGFKLEFRQGGEFSEANILIPIKKTNVLTVYAISEFKMHTAYVRVFFW